jgi:adenylate cyclase
MTFSNGQVMRHFGGSNAGLVLAEVELGRADEAFARPPWLGEEVTYDPRYCNSALAVEPRGRTTPA